MLQEISLNEEFFEENLFECSKRVHPISFLQDYFSSEEAYFDKTSTSEELLSIIQGKIESPIDLDLLEELFDRIHYEKKKNLTLNEFFKVFHEAETVLLLKTEYIRFLLEQNVEIHLKIKKLLKNQSFGMDMHEKLPFKENLINITLVRLIGYKESPCFVSIKYENQLFNSNLAKENGSFIDSAFITPLTSLDSLIEFTVQGKIGQKEVFSIGKTNLSMLYLDFTNKNQVNLVINQGVLELIVLLEFDLYDIKGIKRLLKDKSQELDKENSKLLQEKYNFKTQLGLLFKPFNRGFDPEEYYNFENIPIALPKSLKIFKGMPIEEDKPGLSLKLTQNPMKIKEVREEFDIKTIDMKKTDNYNENNHNNEEINVNTYSLDRFEYQLEKSSIQKKIEQIIDVNQEKNPNKTIEKRENMGLLSRFLLRSDILAIVFVLAGILVNTQRNLFLDVRVSYY